MTDTSVYDLEKERCRKCDFMNNKIPIVDKKPKCGTLEGPFLDCEVFTRTTNLKYRVELLNGDRGPAFFCGEDGCHIEFWEVD